MKHILLLARSLIVRFAILFLGIVFATSPSPAAPAADITVSPTSGLTTSEGGDTAIFTIELTSPPLADVMIGLSSSDTSEGTVSPASVTFSPLDWSNPKIVTISGVDDSMDDGDIPYTIVTAPATSLDLSYNGIDPNDVSVTNLDDDTAGITVNPTFGLVTTESGGQDTFTVVLDTQPTANVTIGLSSSDITEGIASPSSLTFTPANWNSPRTVTVSGVDDFSIDGNVSYTIDFTAAISADLNYSGKVASSVAVLNLDDDAAGITVNPASGLLTTESGGSDSFTVILNSNPSADVTIGLSSSDPSEGTVSPTSLTFTDQNWSIPRTVTVSGVDDDLDDGSILYTIITHPAVSNDPDYHGLDPKDVSVTSVDNDTAGITANPTSELLTSEDGGTANFFLVLNSQPSAAVTIGISSSDTTEGLVSKNFLTFAPDNWDAPQDVTVIGVDDAENDGNVNFTIVTSPAISDDTRYAGVNPADISVTNDDNDGANIEWVSPVATEERYIVERGQSQIVLEVIEVDNGPIARVLFYRWDAILEIHIIIGEVEDPPYRTTLEVGALNYGDNQVFATAYDADGDSSEHERILIMRNAVLYLPSVFHQTIP